MNIQDELNKLRDKMLEDAARVERGELSRGDGGKHDYIDRRIYGTGKAMVRSVCQTCGHETPWREKQS